MQNHTVLPSATPSCRELSWVRNQESPESTPCSFTSWATPAPTRFIVRKAVLDAALRGFVAASVGYTNGAFDGLGCESAPAKARCAFDRNWPDSAINKLCSRPKADCNKGIVVMGHSLGGGIAILASEYNDQVRLVAPCGRTLVRR